MERNLDLLGNQRLIRGVNAMRVRWWYPHMFLAALSLIENRQGWDRGQVGDLLLPLHLRAHGKCKTDKRGQQTQWY